MSSLPTSGERRHLKVGGVQPRFSTAVGDRFHSTSERLHDSAGPPQTTSVRPAEPLPTQAIIWVERQAGVLSRAQLISFGLCDSQVSRLVRQQVLQLLDRGIYVVGVLEPNWHQYA